MDDKRYSKIVLALTLIAFLVSLLPSMYYAKPWESSWLSLRFAWILAILISIVSLFLNERIQNEKSKRFIKYVSGGSIGISLCWMFCYFFENYPLR
jgi:NO-binding membrane sensor protein with MHYT domain